ncbi:LOW QUALITY PROTEIN: hypothetical protein RJ640_001357 [Escallonia rubra]|uniref:Uncharacterized protein n=1 Tax=Escallonia rubra TaxID=112253 RepID=A0AA88QZH3_9ASTE|nr:LOW QUALITY PROTEIN: hypothetical protein RJ640_001357 [Escallonia rubra]
MSSTSSSSSSSSSTSSTENVVKSESESSSSQVGTSSLRSRVETSTLQASTSFPSRDALGDVTDEAKEKFDEDTWFTSDEKRNKMTKESIIELLEEFPLPPLFSARVPALQEPANYDTDLETNVYEGQIRSGNRIPMHPFAVAFFNYYKMVPSQLVLNGWRKLVGLIYLVQTSGYPVTVHDFMRLYLEVCFIKNVAKSVGWYYIHNHSDQRGPKSNKGWHSRYFFILRPSGKWEFPRKWNGFCKDYETKGFLAPNALTKKLLDHIKRRGSLSIDEPLSDQEIRHVGLIPPAPTIPVPPTPVVESCAVLRRRTSELAAGTSSSRTPSLEMSGKGDGGKGDFLGLLLPRGKRKEGTGESSSPVMKRLCAHAPPTPPLLVENLPVDKDHIFHPRWTIKRGDFGMPSSHVSAQHLSHGVLPANKAYCYSSQMQYKFAMAMHVARKAEAEKRAAVSKADRLGNEVDDLKVENTELLAKVNRLEKRCEKLKKAEADAGNKVIQAFLDGTAGEEWLRRRTEDGFQKAKELTVAKYPSLFLDDIVEPTFESPSGETVAPTEAGDVDSQRERSTRSENAPAP